eukprot:sb/3470218/
MTPVIFNEPPPVMDLPFYIRYPVEGSVVVHSSPTPDMSQHPTVAVQPAAAQGEPVPIEIASSPEAMKRATAGSKPQSAIRQGTRQELQLTPSPEPITLPDCKEGEDFVLPTYVMREVNEPEEEQEHEEEVVVPAQKVQSRGGAVVSYAALPPKPSFKPATSRKAIEAGIFKPRWNWGGRKISVGCILTDIEESATEQCTTLPSHSIHFSV